MDIKQFEREIVEQYFQEAIDMVATAADFHQYPNKEHHKNFNFDEIFQKYFRLKDKPYVLNLLDQFRAENAENLDHIQVRTDHRSKDKGNSDIWASVDLPWIETEHSLKINGETASIIRMYRPDDDHEPEYEYQVRSFADFPHITDKRCPRRTEQGGKEYQEDKNDEDEARDEIDEWVSNKMATGSSLIAHELM